MKAKKIIPILFILPLLVGCGDDKKEEPRNLVIPTVDVDSIVPVLPDKPNYNQGPIKSDETYDYLDFYELSDMHGAVNEESHSSGNYIGLPKLANYLDIKRSENEGGTVVVSTGDMFQGSADSNLTRGYMVNYAMNYMGFDSMAIGNHEFDWTDTWLKKNANLQYKGAKTPFISANIVKSGTTETPEFLSKSTIVNRGEYKIGIVGSIGETLKSSILKSCVEGYDFLNEATAVNNEAKRLKETEKCDVVILTSHNDIELLGGKSFENVDAVFGGHAHITKTGTIGGTIPAAQTANYGQSIAHIQLKINKTTKEVTSNITEVDERVTSLSGLHEDANVKTIMRNYDSAIGEIKNIKLGTAQDDLLIKGALKNICVEGMYQSAVSAIKESNLGISEDQIIATFHNIEGGIRKDIQKGTIAYNDVYASFPFDNEVVLYKVKGSVFKNKLSSFSSFAVRRTFKNKDEIDINKEYYLVLTDFIALSSAYVGGILPIAESDLIRTGKVVRDEIANVIYKKENIVATDYSSTKFPYVSIPLI